MNDTKGGFDPDCASNFNDLYCDNVRDDNDVPLALSWTSGYQCEATSSGASCIGGDKDTNKNDTNGSTDDLVCSQLPPMTPKQLAAGHSYNNPPKNWTCDPALYYEADSGKSASYSCDCGCGRKFCF